MMTAARRLVLLAVLLCAGGVVAPGAWAEDQQVIATVNDKPITSFDVDQRLKLMKIIGTAAADRGRKYAANALIDDVVKINEAKKYKADASDKEIDAQLDRMAKALSTDMKGLQGKLSAQGVAMSALRQFIAGQIAFSRILRGKYKVEPVKADPADVDRKLSQIKREMDGKVAKIMADPRMRPITVYMLNEVNFPVEGGAKADPMLINARGVEAQQYMRRVKGCGNLKGAASGIFNVQVGRKMEADGAKLPKPMKSAIDRAGVGRAIGPMRSPSGIQVLVFCGTRKISPPKPKYELPSRAQVESAVTGEKFAAVEQKYMALLRKNALIEYKDQSYAK